MIKEQGLCVLNAYIEVLIPKKLLGLVTRSHPRGIASLANRGRPSALTIHSLTRSDFLVDSNSFITNISLVTNNSLPITNDSLASPPTFQPFSRCFRLVSK